MATTVVKSIGSAGGRDYSDPQTWEDACPVSLTAVDQIWRGECWNDSEFTRTSHTVPVVEISGQTTNINCYVEITAATGHSFQDHATVRSNALTYDVTKGVGFRRISIYYSTGAINPKSDYTRISRLQIKGNNAINADVSGIGNFYKDCIMLSGVSSMLGKTDVSFLNAVFVLDSPSGNGIRIGATGTIIGSTIVRSANNSPAGNGIFEDYSSLKTIQSSAVFGFTTFAAGAYGGTGFGAGSNNNATDLGSAPGSSNQTSVTYSSVTPFTQANASGNDMRPVAATALAANGFYDATNAPNDISGTARAASPTIGAWELASAGVAFIAQVGKIIKQAVKRASYY